jgi:hypothetical protein
LSRRSRRPSLWRPHRRSGHRSQPLLPRQFRNPSSLPSPSRRHSQSRLLNPSWLPLSRRSRRPSLWRPHRRSGHRSQPLLPRQFRNPSPLPLSSRRRSLNPLSYPSSLPRPSRNRRPSPWRLHRRNRHRSQPLRPRQFRNPSLLPSPSRRHSRSQLPNPSSLPRPSRNLRLSLWLPHRRNRRGSQPLLRCQFRNPSLLPSPSRRHNQSLLPSPSSLSHPRPNRNLRLSR